MGRGTHRQRSWVSNAEGGSATQREAIVLCSHWEPFRGLHKVPSTDRHSQVSARRLSMALSGGIRFTSTPYSSGLRIYVDVEGKGVL